MNAGVAGAKRKTQTQQSNEAMVMTVVVESEDTTIS